MKRRSFLVAGLGAALLPGSTLLAPVTQTGSIIRRDLTGTAKRLYTASDLAFGTTITMHVLHHDQRDAELAMQDAFAQAKNIDALMSIHSQTSQVSLLNAHGIVRDPDPHLLTVLAESARLSELTHGAFDITVQPLWNQFAAAAAQNTLPTEAARKQVQELVDWRAVQLEPRQVRLARPSMAITLNGIAQGYAVDLALNAVRARGIEHALLDTGEFISIGSKAGHPWLVGVQDPRHADQLSTLLGMDGRSVATSGDYETFFTADFAHHHIFDPGTGDSPLELASVTVAAPSGLLADGLSTAFFVMGHEKSLQLIQSMPQVDALFIDKNGRACSSAGLRALTQT